jgi:hypothetical protein
MPSAQNSSDCCLNYCSTLSCTSMANMNLRGFVNGPNIWKYHGDKSMLSTACLSSYHRRTFSWSWSARTTWQHTVKQQGDAFREFFHRVQSQFNAMWLKLIKQPQLIMSFSHLWIITESPKIHITQQCSGSCGTAFQAAAEGILCKWDMPPCASKRLPSKCLRQFSLTIAILSPMGILEWLSAVYGTI